MRSPYTATREQPPLSTARESLFPNNLLVKHVLLDTWFESLVSD